MNQSSTRTYVGFNFVSLVLALTLNFLAISLPLNNKTTGELSDNFPNYFVPAGFTFSIWGIIYLLLIVFVGYQGWQYFKSNQKVIGHIQAIGPWFFVNGTANASWIIAWHFEMVGVALMIMFVLLFSLIKIYMILEDRQPLTFLDNLAIKMPFSVYLAWISVATMANLTTFLIDMGWTGNAVAEPKWAILLVIIAAGLGLWMVYRKKDLPFSLVIIWALFGIYSKQSALPLADSAQVALVAKYSMTMLLIYTTLNLVGRRSYFFEK